MNSSFHDSSPFEALPGCLVRTVGFDFAQRQTVELRLAGCEDAAKRGMFVWHDVEILDVDAARPALEGLSLFDPSLSPKLFGSQQPARYARYEHGLHLVLTGCRLEGTDLALERVDALLDARRLVTIHRGAPLFLKRMRREFAADFARYAQTPTFLVFELFDHLVANYVEVQRRLEERVEALQHRVSTEFDDSLFTDVSGLGGELLRFRRLLMPARAVLSELSNRRNVFINEGAQPYLARMVGEIDRVLDDVLVGRDILTEAVSLRMTVLAHRTNETVKRLTVVSVIFLPLTFLCGVYGMNFEFPEKAWGVWGYAWFWGLALTLAAVILTIMRRQRLL